MVHAVIGVCYVQSFQMTDLAPTAESKIKRFVRDCLACTCPDQIFEDIRVSERMDIFPLANTVYEIGGRLVVAVLVPSDWHQLENNLEPLIDAGKLFRDHQGYNRFRLVVATDDDEAIARLQVAFDCLANVDEKTHLHVIRPEALP